MERRRVGILIFDDVEVLDFCGPFEVFSATRQDEQRRREEPSPFAMVLVAETMDAVTTTGGMRVLPQVRMAQCPPLDVLVVPGGVETRREMLNTELQHFVRAQTGLVTSVCTGALVLGKAGLLDGLRATTHWRALDLLQEVVPLARVERTVHIVDEGRIMTSAGVSAGIDLALRVVARFHGESIAWETAKHMEYPYPDGNARRMAFTEPDPAAYRIDFRAMTWETPMAGVRSRTQVVGDRRVRMVEWGRAMPAHWCEKGHAGCILEGELEVEFDRGTWVFRAGDGLVIPDGAAHRHRARTLTDTVTAVLVEKA